MSNDMFEILQSLFGIRTCNMSRHITVLNEVDSYYWRLKAEGRELTVRMTAHPTDSTAYQHVTGYFVAGEGKLFRYALRDLEPGNIVRISIHNTDNRHGRTIGLSFRRDRNWQTCSEAY
jgi:hypothetical protein